MITGLKAFFTRLKLLYLFRKNIHQFIGCRETIFNRHCKKQVHFGHLDANSVINVA